MHRGRVGRDQIARADHSRPRGLPQSDHTPKASCKVLDSAKFCAWSKALPERDQKRSRRGNHMILESNTETCSKHDFSMIFVGYSSRILCEFDGFPQISQFLHTVLTASRMRIGSKCVHFHGFGWIRAIFGSKSTKILRLEQSVTGT